MTNINDTELNVGDKVCYSGTITVSTFGRNGLVDVLPEEGVIVKVARGFYYVDLGGRIDRQPVTNSRVILTRI